jgi:protein AbiQ
MDLKFYHINKLYVNYLREFDNKVTLIKNSGKLRPYIGIVYKIDNYEYFAPLSSPKKDSNGNLLESYKNKYRNNPNPLYEQIDHLKYGTIQINNMIPVPSIELKEFDIKKEQDVKYKSVLLDQLIYIDNHKEKILKKANRLYEFVTKHKITKFIQLSCDFKLLEGKCDEYIKANHKT